jgi:hypothetical protein
METLGGLIDKLSVVNIRIWFAEDIKRGQNATDKQIADACKVTNLANSQRNDLIQEIDELINQLVITGVPQRLYKQGATKLYGKEGPGFSRLDAAGRPSNDPVTEVDTVRDFGAAESREK